MEMIPIVDGLKVEFAGKASALQLNAGQSGNEELQTRWGLRGHPSFAILDADGQVIERFFGPQPESQLRIALQTAVSS